MATDNWAPVEGCVLAAIRGGACQVGVRSIILKMACKVAGQGHCSFIHGKVIGILCREAVLIDEHLMLPFRLDVVPNLGE